jgi:hypothetical protein
VQGHISQYVAVSIHPPIPLRIDVSFYKQNTNLT